MKKRSVKKSKHSSARLSACGLLLPLVQEHIWHRGWDYADSGVVFITKDTDTRCEGKVRGSRDYTVVLSITAGKVSARCNCPYAKSGDNCKHMAAMAIMWDEKNGIKRPSETVVGKKAGKEIQPADDFSEIESAPLTVNLNLLRRAVDYYVRSSRPHAILPDRPEGDWDESKSLKPAEVRKIFSGIRAWSRAKNYDPYFCAGEMLAGYCEAVRNIKKRLVKTRPEDAAKILMMSAVFLQDLIYRMIDSSDGTWMAATAHLNDLHQSLKSTYAGHEDNIYTRLMEEYEDFNFEL